MPVSFQNRSAAAVAHAPAGAGAIAQNAPGHPAHGAVAIVAVAAAGAAAVAPAAAPSLLRERLAALPVRVGRLGARTLVGGAMAGAGCLTTGGASWVFIAREIRSYAQNDFSAKHVFQSHDSVLPGVVIGAGVVLGVAGALLMRSARSAVSPEVESRPSTAQSTPCNSGPGSPV